MINPLQKDEVYLNLMLEYVPETVYRASRHYAKLKQPMPMLQIKLYMYQLLRSLAYIHSVILQQLEPLYLHIPLAGTFCATAIEVHLQRHPEHSPPPSTAHLSMGTPTNSVHTTKPRKGTVSATPPSIQRPKILLLTCRCSL